MESLLAYIASSVADGRTNDDRTIITYTELRSILDKVLDRTLATSRATIRDEVN